MLCMYVRAVVFGCIFVTSIFAVNCPKGSFISSVGCTPCPENEYSDSVNSTKCWKCDECKGRHNLVTRVCNSTSNTKCACEPGFYWDDALFCLKCDRCKRGHGMVKNCTSDSNTVCEHCEHGKTYSDKKDFNSCRNCSICPDGYFEQRRCSRKNDTICLKDTEQNKSKNNWKIDNRGRSSGSRQRGGSKPRLKNKNSTQSPIPLSTNTSSKTFDGSSSLKSTEMVTTGSEMDLVIALGVVSGFAFLVLIVTLSLMFFIRRKSRKSTKDNDKERVEDPTPSASATEVARENPYTSLPHIGTGQGIRELDHNIQIGSVPACSAMTTSVKFSESQRLILPVSPVGNKTNEVPEVTGSRSEKIWRNTVTAEVNCCCPNFTLVSKKRWSLRGGG